MFLELLPSTPCCIPESQGVRVSLGLNKARCIRGALSLKTTSTVMLEGSEEVHHLQTILASSEVLARLEVRDQWMEGI